ncbi:hypothetical protein FKP32DRAFT_1591388 [Trametes sanguinea]|nr:hypothetical protein FKP32DRAFT_1591388 [Trametes sanguinea]
MSSSASPVVLTYRFNEKLVYVTKPTSYQEAIKYARQLFPELALLPSDHIGICINGLVCQKRELIRISPMAWKPVIQTRTAYEVLDIIIDDPEAVDPVEDGPPAYADAAGKDPLESTSGQSRIPRHTIIINPDCKEGLRVSSSTPSSTSRKSVVEWAKGLLIKNE